MNRMSGAPDLGRLFSALADPTLRAILQRLSQGDPTVGEPVRPFAMPQPEVSCHPAVLQAAGSSKRPVAAPAVRAGCVATARAWQRPRPFRDDRFLSPETLLQTIADTEREESADD